jgi:hypothetical protein
LWRFSGATTPAGNEKLDSHSSPADYARKFFNVKHKTDGGSAMKRIALRILALSFVLAIELG